MSATLHFGDCLDVMKSLPDKSIDCFICDLPYGQLTSGGIQTSTELKAKYKRKETDVIGGCEWDVKLDLEKMWEQIKRLCKDDHTPVLMFCNTKFGYELIKSNESWFRYDLVWDKERGVSFLLANKMPMKSHEMIYVFSKKGSYYKRIDEKRCVNSVIVCKKTGSQSHPTEKPRELYKWLLERYCPAKGRVLDPTAGSFNSIIAAKELGLNGVGIEKNRNFYWKAVAKLIV